MPETRRGFIVKSAAIAAASYTRILGANDRVQLGLIGYGLIGAFHVKTYNQYPDAVWTGISDVYKPRLEAGRAACGNEAKAYPDFRALLDAKDVDAVVIATPDHWHALHTILACEAGKDVYVEKPMTLFQKEGSWMMAAAKRFNRIVQVGTQGRSAPHLPEVRSILKRGELGSIHSARIGYFRNIMPGFGKPPDSDPPADLDYDMWLGPAPKTPYNRNRSLYHFRWFWNYSGGQMTNLGAHDLDFVYNLLQLDAPTTVFSAGGRYVLTNDNGETPDTQDATFCFPGVNVTLTIREASAGRKHGVGLEFFGSKGTLTLGRRGFEVFPDEKIAPESAIPAWSGVPGHPQPDRIAPEPWTEARKVGNDIELMDLHSRNFLDCVKSRKTPNASVEIGHQIATACHLANISLRLNRSIRWNAQAGTIEGDAEAAAMLERPYRKPWDDVIRRLKL
jgi:predicted dehydrogenase